MPVSAAARVATVRALARAGGAAQRAQQSPADHGRHRPRRGEIGGQQRIGQAHRRRVGCFRQSQQGDVVLRRTVLRRVILVQADLRDIDPAPVFVEVVGADQRLQVSRRSAVHAMPGGQHPPGSDHRASAELPAPGWFDERHLPGIRAGFRLGAADDARMALRGRAALRLLGGREPRRKRRRAKQDSAEAARGRRERARRLPPRDPSRHRPSSAGAVNRP